MRPIGQAGLDLIKQFEGCQLQAYLDPVGIWTIGYGHTYQVKPGMKITQDQAEAYLAEDVQSYANAVDDVRNVAVTKELNANQRDALISFAYNCGTGSLKQLCRGRSIAEIARHIPAYNKGIHGKVLPGLTRRRAAELALYDTPIDQREVEEMRYNTVEEVPDWAKETVGKLVEKGVLSGNGSGLDLSLDMLRLLVILDRAGRV